MPGDGHGRALRIAAVGDIHHGSADSTVLSELLRDVESGDAEVLVIAGDLTTHGEPSQMRMVAKALEKLKIPVIAVFGNHDHEAGAVEEAATILAEAGVQLLDGDAVEIGGIGFAGTKGFAGGFGRYSLGAFGEPLIKRFVQEAIDEALKLENALRSLRTRVKVVVTHYSPIVDTLLGEPEPLYPYLGSSRLLSPIDTLGADVVFHGHAHSGTLEGRTPEGIPVYNVSLSLLRDAGRSHLTWTTEAPERRGDR